MRQIKPFRRILLKSTLVLSLLPCALQSKIQAADTSTPASMAEQYLLAAANRERQSRGLQPLRRDPVLARAAAFHARQMADHADISHGFPGEPELADRAATAGVRFSLISENVGEAPDSTEIHEMWMQSEGHRENLLDPNVNVVGISVIVRDDQFYAVEDFVSTVETLSINQQETAVANIIASSGGAIGNTLAVNTSEPAIQSARQTCSMHTGYAGSNRPWFVMRYTAADLNHLPSPLQARLGSGKYHQAAIGACSSRDGGPFSTYSIAVLLYP
ncbi:CAP domain-containing protein [Granulicella sp. dw_53]|uniref:CAP domain-containing protein n=1 Tax=Granulicella sp. dw_53 TaxID=2719792 RepID=UPI001BD6CCD3|nr:CAP domain-containing protein [Granulicella sp. dw_53]